MTGILGTTSLQLSRSHWSARIPGGPSGRSGVDHRRVGRRNEDPFDELLGRA